MSDLDRLLREQRVLAWLLSWLTFGITIGFFAVMGFNVPALSRAVFGSAITLVNVLAITIIILFLISIWLFGRRAAKIDELMFGQSADK